MYSQKNINEYIIYHIKECINGIDNIHYHDDVDRLFYTFNHIESDDSDSESVVTSDDESVDESVDE
jgi:hypothetical protein